MRICYLVPGFSRNEDDWCIPVLRDTIEHLAREVEVVVYTLHYPFRRSTYRAFGATVHCLSDRRETGLQRLLRWRELKRRVASDHAARPFTLIHSFWATETGFLATSIARRLGLPSVVSVGGGELARLKEEGYGSGLHPLQRYFVATSFARADALTAGSGWIIDQMPEPYRSRTQRLPLGTNTTLFSAGAVRSGHRLLAVSSLYPWKDLPTILRAVALAVGTIPDLTLDIAGEGVCLDQLRSLADQLDIASRVRFLGSVGHDRLPECYRSADLLLHAGLYESQGMIITEALATGLPVVATDVGVAHDLPSDLLYRVAPRDVEGMAAAILRSLADGRHASAAMTKGVALIEREYSLERATEQFLVLYRGVSLQ